MRRDKVKRVSLILFGIIFLYSSPAYANAALPLVFLSLPGMALALVPVIAMESYVLMKILGLSMGSGLSVVFVANVVSTIVGLPVTWLLLLPLAKLPEHEIPGVLWFMPLYGVEKYPKDWMVPAASLLLLIPYFFVSWFFEYRIAMHMLDGFEPQNLCYGVLVGNLVSYGILALIVLGWLIWEIRRTLATSSVGFYKLSLETPDHEIGEQADGLERLIEKASAYDVEEHLEEGALVN